MSLQRTTTRYGLRFVSFDTSSFHSGGGAGISVCLDLHRVSKLVTYDPKAGLLHGRE